MRDTLTHAEARRFYLLRNSLGVMAHEWLELDGSVFVDPAFPDEIDNEAMHETMQETWERPDIIDRFVSENPLSLAPAQLQTVSSWKHHVKGYFTVFRHANALLFMAEGRIFHVLGILDTIDELIGEGEDFPIFVKTTLLPFEDRIVHDGWIVKFPMNIGATMRRNIENDIAEALKDGVHISTAERLAAEAPAIAEQRIKNEAERMVHDLEMEMKAEDQLPGHHAGILVGLPEGERKGRIHKRMHEILDERTGSGPQFDFEGYFKQWCTKGAPRRDLHDLLLTETKDTLRHWSWFFGLPYGQSLTKAKLADALAPKLAASDFLTMVALEQMTLDELEAFKRVYAAGGELSIAADELKSYAAFPPCDMPACYLFFEDGIFTCVIPEQLMDQLDNCDWEHVESTVRDFQRSADVADALVALRGIVTLDEAFGEFQRCYPDGFGILDFQEGVRGALQTGYLSMGFLESDDGEVYLLHYALADMLREEQGLDTGYGADPFLEGDLGALGNLLEAREGKMARTLDEGVRSSADVYDWIEARPAVRALRNYLDAHVPDSQDDCFFADAVIEDLVEHMKFGVMRADDVRICLEILEDHDFTPDEAHLNKVLGLLTNMANAMPNWLNNGWAPAELSDALTGKKTFYNEDGSVRKVGRNEPCPCGSGKKYKRCCGR